MNCSTIFLCMPCALITRYIFSGKTFKKITLGNNVIFLLCFMPPLYSSLLMWTLIRKKWPPHKFGLIWVGKSWLFSFKISSSPLNTPLGFIVTFLQWRIYISRLSSSSYLTCSYTYTVTDNLSTWNSYILGFQKIFIRGLSFLLGSAWPLVRAPY